MPKIEEVEQFWNSKPLFSGESKFELGSKEFFDEHSRVIIEDGFAGKLDDRFFPTLDPSARILDLGCGPGFWTVEFFNRGYQNVLSADLTGNALELTKKRTQIYGYKANTSKQNAENLSLEESSFDHVHCQGVIHHSPSPENCIREISRVLKPGGSAMISVYYKSPLLRAWPILKRSTFGRISNFIELKGRDREDIAKNSDIDEIVRIYDGKDNPIGVCFSKSEYLKMLEPYFKVTDMYLHHFPVRALKIKLPQNVHKWLNHRLGLVLCANLKKK